MQCPRLILKQGWTCVGCRVYESNDPSVPNLMGHFEIPWVKDVPENVALLDFNAQRSA